MFQTFWDLKKINKLTAIRKNIYLWPFFSTLWSVLKTIHRLYTWKHIYNFLDLKNIFLTTFKCIIIYQILLLQEQLLHVSLQNLYSAACQLKLIEIQKEAAAQKERDRLAGKRHRRKEKVCYIYIYTFLFV